LVVATIYEALGELGRARVELERVVEAQPLEPLTHYRLAMLYQRLRSPGLARAMHHLEIYLELAPDGVHAAEAKDALRLARTTRAENASVITRSGDPIGKLP
jgi:Tfp pilus assembly protein PilF